MAELKNRFNQIMADIEEHITNKEDLEYVKSQIWNISTLFLDELDRLVDINLNKMDTLLQRHTEINDRISKMEGIINNIEKDIYLEDDTYDFEIICPYCNNEFTADFSVELKNEVKCPECNNIIELDWNEEELDCCNGDCHCAGECNDNTSEESYYEEDEEDDM